MTAQPNAELAYRVLDVINANPAHFDMNDWVRAPHDRLTVGLEQLTSPECGTTACFAGWAVVLSGYELTRDREIVKANRVVPTTLPAFASDLLGLNEDQAADLFYVDNEDFSPKLVAEIFGPRPRSCCSSTEDVGHDFTCPKMLADAGVSVDDVPPNAGSAS